MSEQADNIEFSKKMLAGYLKDEKAVRSMLDSLTDDDVEEKYDDLLSEDWYTKANSDFGGKTPEEAVKEHYDGAPDFDAFWTLYETFLNDGLYEVPEGIVKGFAAFGDDAGGVIARLIHENKKAIYIKFDKKVTPEEDRAGCILMTLLKDAPEFSGDDIKDALWEIFDDAPEYADAVNETAAESIVNAYGPWTVADHLAKAENIGDKETTLMQAIASSGERDEMLYKTLRKCVKKAPPMYRVVSMAILTDYGDNRAVSLLRTLAKEMHDMIVSMDQTYTSQDLYEVFEMIKELGGNTEDLA